MLRAPIFQNIHAYHPARNHTPPPPLLQDPLSVPAMSYVHLCITHCVRTWKELILPSPPRDQRSSQTLLVWHHTLPLALASVQAAGGGEGEGGGRRVIILLTHTCTYMYLYILASTTISIAFTNKTSCNCFQLHVANPVPGDKVGSSAGMKHVSPPQSLTYRKHKTLIKWHKFQFRSTF